MIIVYRKYGDHSNRLIQNLHFEAFCLENHIQYRNPTFSDMRKYYRSPVETDKISAEILKFHLAGDSRKFKIRHQLIHFEDIHQNYTQMLLESQAKNHYCFVEGFGFRVNDLTLKYQDYFIQKYTLKEEYYRTNELYNKFIRNRDENTLLVGVHVRRGDYRKYKNGKFFFSDDTYRKYVVNLKKALLARYNKQPIFIVFSNECADFLGDQDTIISKNEWYVDQYLMSQCDYIIGPLSTFSFWASYIGKTKYCFMKDDPGKVNLDHFGYSRG